MEHEFVIRLGAFGGTLCAMMLWELAAPRRPLSRPRGARWARNLGLLFLDTAFVRACFPVLAVGLAARAQEQGLGFFNRVELPGGLEAALAFLALDLIIYLQHVLFHAVPLFWRFHRVHHADLDFDATTGNRFHPGEIALSLLIKLAAVALLGPSPATVIAFEVALNACAIFNHSNVGLPGASDRFVRLFLVTPDMHRVHHSAVKDETDSNFGFNLPWWDRLFGTYRADARAGQAGMTIGLSEFRDPASQGFLGML
ncbi:MAG: sterol desaturase family protein, partial [Elusimicrobiota bacterium]